MAGVQNDRETEVFEAVRHADFPRAAVLLERLGIDEGLRLRAAAMWLMDRTAALVEGPVTRDRLDP